MFPHSRTSNCFTKAYSKFVEGTGSVLQTADSNIRGIEGKSESLLSLKLRYFTPKEVANLHRFPESFQFPEQLTSKQRYQLLGNSLNVEVVAHLVQYLLTEPKE